jgi:hypothetical protein
MKQRRWWITALVGGTIILLTLFAATTGKNTSGSTYGRSPDGYGAWYQYMQQQGTPGQRWQRPLSELTRSATNNQSKPRTLLQIYAGVEEQVLDGEKLTFRKEQETWIQQGNTLVILGIDTPVTTANFKTEHPSPTGNIKIETTQRLPPPLMGKEQEPLLSDRYGTIIWQQSLGKGNIILAVTPYLGANAYQNTPNFPFLAQLVTQTGGQWWVDEYLHGFKDRDVVTKETAGSWLAYLAKTPLLFFFLQSVILLTLLIWSGNRRFGLPQRLDNSVEDNSTAYIQALASVLQKAKSSEFVMETLGREEQVQLQRRLGLGSTPLEPETLLAVWTEQTGHSSVELQQFLQGFSHHQRLNDFSLAAWLENLQKIRSQV